MMVVLWPFHRALWHYTMQHLSFVAIWKYNTDEITFLGIYKIIYLIPPANFPQQKNPAIYRPVLIFTFIRSMNAAVSMPRSSWTSLQPWHSYGIHQWDGLQEFCRNIYSCQLLSACNQSNLFYPFLEASCTSIEVPEIENNFFFNKYVYFYLALKNFILNFAS